MGKPRKTVKVKEIIDNINEQLANSPDYYKEIRKGLMIVAEDILFSSNNYCGFGYLADFDVPEGFSCGVRNVEGLPNFENTDGTRVKYYVKG